MRRDKEILKRKEDEKSYLFSDGFHFLANQVKKKGENYFPYGKFTMLPKKKKEQKTEET